LDRLTVPEAATLLGVTRDAVYKRVQRGQIPWDKDNEGRVYVYVDASKAVEDESTDTGGESTDSSTNKAQDTERDALLEALREQNELLRAELSVWQEEARRKDTIIMTMAQRIPELEAPPEARESPETASEEPAKGDDDVPEEERRPWWRRMFGP
jgi:excisionase family DNA binding protein